MACAKKPNVLVFACGEPEWGEGGSGFEAMVKAMRANPPILKASICGVVSNHCNGGVAEKAERLGIRFRCWKGPPFTAEGYKNFTKFFNADFVMLSGWVWPEDGLPAELVVNIHPAPLNYSDPTRHFGGKGFHGLRVHEKVLEAYKHGLIDRTEVTLHYVPPFSRSKYDTGPIIARFPVEIQADDTPVVLQDRVKVVEHFWQSRVLDHVVHGRVKLKDKNVIYKSEELKRQLMPAA
jgi:folate-dependent phosphoribosylglycinamide formyltransferase PurN